MIFLTVFAVLVLLAMFVGIFKAMLTEDSVSKYIKNSDIFNCSSSEVLGEGSASGTLGQLISKDFLKFGISEEVTEEVLCSEELNDVLANYLYNYVNYVLFSVDKEDLSSDELLSVVQNKYFEIEGRNLDGAQEMLVREYVGALSTKLNASTPSIEQLQALVVDVGTLRIVANISFSAYIWFILGSFILGAFTMVVICLRNKLKAFNWCSTALVIDGIILMVVSFLEVKLFSMFVNSKGIIDNLAITIANKSFENLLFYGIALMIVGIIFLIICAVLWKKESKLDSDMLLNSVIEEEVGARKELKDHIVRTDEDIDRTLTRLNKVEIEKVLLDESSEATSDEKIIINSDTEIPEVKLSGSDFVQSDIGEVEPLGDIYSVKDEKVLDFEDLEFVDVNDDIKEDEIVNEELVNNEFEIIETENEEEEGVSLEEDMVEKSGYEEIDDSRDEEAVKQDIEILPLEEIKLDIVSPKKGKDIEVKIDEVLNNDEEEEEEIEVL